jgi:hypothetical protein
MFSAAASDRESCRESAVKEMQELNCGLSNYFGQIKLSAGGEIRNFLANRILYFPRKVW